MVKGKEVKAVLLDVDGTLIDSNSQHARCYYEAGKELGSQYTYDEVFRFVGMGNDKMAPVLIGESSESERGKQLVEKKTKTFKEKFAKQVKPFPKYKELIQKMKDSGLKVIITTSAQESELKEMLKHLEIDQLVDDTSTSSDVDGSKPDEDLVVVGLRKAGLEGHPESAIMVGDTPYDVVSADKAGVRTVAVRCGGWDMKDFEEAGKTIDVLKGSDTTPEELFDDPADLLARFHTSLLAK